MTGQNPLVPGLPLPRQNPIHRKGAPPNPPQDPCVHGSPTGPSPRVSVVVSADGGRPAAARRLPAVTAEAPQGGVLSAV